MDEIFKKAVLPVLLVAIALYLRGDEREEAKAEAHAEVAAICAVDQRCLQRVEPWFDHCFTMAYQGGTKRTRGRLDWDAFERCMNEHLPEHVFTDRQLTGN